MKPSAVDLATTVIVASVLLLVVLAVLAVTVLFNPVP
jgi:hypothetical protein